MSVAAINSSSLPDAAATLPSAARIPVQTLDQDDFLRLLVAQLMSQDPLNPKQDTDFIAQMASFSSLEQARTMQTELARLRADQELLKANALLGRTVDVQIDDRTVATGPVSAVLIEAGKPRVVVNGASYGLNQILAIAPATPDPQPQP